MTDDVTEMDNRMPKSNKSGCSDRISVWSGRTTVRATVERSEWPDNGRTPVEEQPGNSLSGWRAVGRAGNWMQTGGRDDGAGTSRTKMARTLTETEERPESDLRVVVAAERRQNGGGRTGRHRTTAKIETSPNNNGDKDRRRDRDGGDAEKRQTKRQPNRSSNINTRTELDSDW